MYTPAVTIVAAWISALTGVGPSMASGSHTCSGTCADLPTAPMNNSSAMAVSTAGPAAPGPASWAALTPSSWCCTSRKSTLWKVTNSSSTASTKPTSPTRLTTNAFLPASLALWRVYQKPISRYEHSPTPSQPTNISR